MLEVRADTTASEDVIAIIIYIMLECEVSPSLPMFITIILSNYVFLLHLFIRTYIHTRILYMHTYMHIYIYPFSTYI